jgi:diaminopropionate ammonia-lyase
VGRVVLNPNAVDRAVREERLLPSETEQATAFHRDLPGYVATPLREVPELADQLGLKEIWVKDESSRFGLPAFKILGASWATARTLGERLGATGGLHALRRRLKQREDLYGGPLELVTATDGNHGRAVARVARWLGCRATVFMPAETVPARVEAISAEGADVKVVEADYDATVLLAAAHADEAGGLLVQDTSWAGYEEIPRRVIEGYATLLTEIREALEARGRPMPDLAIVPIGVGSLAAAFGVHPDAPARLVGVEPTGAACALESIESGESKTACGEGRTIMAGLNCGTLASLAWPVIRARYAAVTAVDDDRAQEAMLRLAQLGLVAGESGAASLAGLIELVEGPAEARRALGLGPKTRALVLLTEGATDPDSYARIVG